MTVKICSAAGCTNAKKTSLYCPKHNYRMRKYGSAEKPINATMKWLLLNIKSCGEECLIWPFYRDKDGYAKVTVRGKSKSAHRISCESINGMPFGGAYSCLHSCGNGHLGCVNPKHLYWGSPAQNAADRISHAISAGQPASPRAKLIVSQVIEIRKRLSDGESRRLLAKEFNVSKAAVHDIASGRSWAFLAEDAA